MLLDIVFEIKCVLLSYTIDQGEPASGQFERWANESLAGGRDVG